MVDRPSIPSALLEIEAALFEVQGALSSVPDDFPKRQAPTPSGPTEGVYGVSVRGHRKAQPPGRDVRPVRRAFWRPIFPIQRASHAEPRAYEK
jgi:hypothetical protein